MRKRFLFFLLIGPVIPAFSQSDSLFFSVVFDGKPAKDGGAGLYNGKEHVGYLPSIEGSAYYGSKEWLPGSLTLHGMLYKDALLKYDLVADEVIILHSNGFTGVTLFTPRVESFTLNNKRFVQLADHTTSGLKGGIYEELLRGKLSLYVKRSKKIQQTILTNGIEKKFVDNSSHFILKEGNYYPIKNEKALTDLLSEKREEVTTWMKTSGINYKSNPEDALIKIVGFYNQISR
ncbi:MAG: hypothetical protein EOO10_04475 [Chitinophagaceae bacterium]|nr:MAG: hypothetical protein EOO10_04475 [Chitinophagaceae bacterium]